MIGLLALVACGAPGGAEVDPHTTPESAEPAEIQPLATPAPERAATASTACNVSLFVYESDPKGLVVYSEPRRGAAEVGTYPVDTIVKVSEVQGPWAHLSATSDDGTALPGGWAGIELLTTHLRTPEEYGPQAVPTYRAKPGTGGPEKRFSLPLEWVTVTSCKGTWLQAEWEDSEGQTGSGWIAAGTHCPQPSTTCP